MSRELEIGDKLQDCAATMTFLGYAADGQMRFHDSLEGDEFTLHPNDLYLASLPLVPDQDRTEGFGR
jgi:hypothetical protein